MSDEYINYFNDINNLNQSLVGKDNVLKNSDINFCQVILPNKEGKISVIGKYIAKEIDDVQLYKLNKKGNDVELLNIKDEYYYGVSPKIDGEILENLNKKLKGSNKQTKKTLIDEFIKDNHNCFCIPNKYYSNIRFKNKNIEVHLKDLLPAIARYVVICIIDKYNDIEINPDKNKQRVFYSGSFLKMCKINGEKQLKGNGKISPLELVFTKSSYGMVYAFDDNKTHLFKKYYDKYETEKYIEDIKKFYAIQDKAFNNLNDEITNIHKLKTNNENKRSKIIESINTYLKDSVFVNQIGVSSTLVTSDEYFIISERPNTDYDKGQFYPAVNGNAELKDNNVEFYKYSVSNDYPTICVDDDRIDFFNEITREAGDELEILFSCAERNYYGVTISGIIPETKKNLKKRRCNFNILFENESERTFDEICSSAEESVESFEIKRLYGIKMPYRSSKRNIILSMLKFLYDNAVYYATLLLVLSKAIDDYNKSEIENKNVYNFIKDKFISITNIFKNSNNVFDTILKIFSLNSLNNFVDFLTIVIALFYIHKFISAFLARLYAKTSVWVLARYPYKVLNRVVWKFSKLRFFNNIRVKIITFIDKLFNKQENKNTKEQDTNKQTKKEQVKNKKVNIKEVIFNKFAYHINNVRLYFKCFLRSINSRKTYHWGFKNKPYALKQYHPVTYTILCCYVIEKYWDLHSEDN